MTDVIIASVRMQHNDRTFSQNEQELEDLRTLIADSSLPYAIDTLHELLVFVRALIRTGSFDYAPLNLKVCML